MKSKTFAAVSAVLLSASANSGAESAQEILDAAWAAQVNRWAGLDSYLVEQSVMGRKTNQYFVRTTMAGADGSERTLFMPVPELVVKPGCVDMSSLTTSQNSGIDGSAELSWFLDNAELVGEETVGGNAAWQLHADDIGQAQPVNGQDVKMNSMTMWLDKDDYVPLKMRIDGEARVEGQARPVVIETLHSDFRTVPGTQLREPFHRLVTISGMMQGVDPAQVAEAQAQLEQMEAQMASMPEAQRQMMEKMMGPQLEMVRKMARTGGIETEIVVNSITPNPRIEGTPVVACEAG